MQLANFEVGGERPFFLLAGPCVIESGELVMEVAGSLREITQTVGIPFIFKASFDKANRTSGASFRGPGIAKGLAILEQVRREFGVPVLTDVHEDTPLAEVAAVVDVLQTPAFLCRQTNFIQAVASQGRPVNIKKGNFWHLGICSTWWLKPARSVTTPSWCASAARALAITIWYPICVPSW